MMNKEKIISLSLVGAISLGSCTPAMAVKTDGRTNGRRGCGSSLGSSQSGAINNVEDVNEDIHGQAKKDFEDAKRKIEEVKRIVGEALGDIRTTMCADILAERKIIEEVAKERHKEIDEAVKKTAMENEEIDDKEWKHFERKRAANEECEKAEEYFEEVTKEADENLKQIQKEAKEQHEVIDQAKVAKLKEFDGTIDDREKEVDEQLQTLHEKILGIIEQKQTILEAMIEELGNKKNPGKEEIEQLKKVKNDIEKYFKLPDALTSLRELIKKFGTFQKIKTTKLEVSAIYKEVDKECDEIDDIVETCEAEDHVLNYRADEIYIGEIYTTTNNNEILKNEREKFAGIKKIHEEYDEICSKTRKIYNQLSWHTYDRVLDEFCQKIVEFSNKLKSSPEMLNLLEEIFGEDFKYIAQKCNKFEEVYVACNQTKEESETYLKLRNKFEVESKEFDEMHEKFIIKDDEYKENESKMEKLREDIIGKLEIFVKSKHISGLGGIEECCRDIDKKYKEIIDLAKNAKATKSEFEIAKGEFKIAKDAFNEVAKKANEKSKKEVKKAEEILANHQQLITLAKEGRVADKYVVLAHDEIRKIYEAREAELVESERWVDKVNKKCEEEAAECGKLWAPYELGGKWLNKGKEIYKTLKNSEARLIMQRALVKEANEILANERKELSILEKALKAAEEM